MARMRRSGGKRRLARFSTADMLLAASLLLASGAIVAMLPERDPGEFIEGAGKAVDGDSVRLAGHDIRLWGIDAPEREQTCQRAGETWRCGAAARGALASWLARGPARCKARGFDVYGRTLAICHVGDIDVNAALVREGMAVSYGGYREQEAEAQAARRGVWAGDFQSPREWRANHPRAQR